MQGHVMYRSWCPHCVRIRGRANPHSKSDSGNERAYRILHWDYAYLSSSSDKEEAEEQVHPSDDGEGGGVLLQAWRHQVGEGVQCAETDCATLGKAQDEGCANDGEGAKEEVLRLGWLET